jgi:hypothetical protein
LGAGGGAATAAGPAVAPGEPPVGSRAAEPGLGDFQASYPGLSDAELLTPGVQGDWSVRDIIAHLTWWEEEALVHLPLVTAGGRPPRYSTRYGGIDAFNALMAAERRHLSLAEVRTQHGWQQAKPAMWSTEPPSAARLRHCSSSSG